MADDPYLLGHHDLEWDRLQEQYALWGPVMLDDLATLGLGPGWRAAEVGCGSGALLAELARRVGPTGTAWGLEQDPTAAAAAAQAVPAHFAALGLEDLGVVPHVGAGGPDSPVYRWVGRFLHEHLDTVIDAGLVTEVQAEEFKADRARVAATPGALLTSPLQVTVAGRRPGPRTPRG